LTDIGNDLRTFGKVNKADIPYEGLLVFSNLLLHLKDFALIAAMQVPHCFFLSRFPQTSGGIGTSTVGI